MSLQRITSPDFTTTLYEYSDGSATQFTEFWSEPKMRERMSKAYAADAKLARTAYRTEDGKCWARTRDLAKWEPCEPWEVCDGG